MINKCWNKEDNKELEYLVFDGFTDEFIDFVNAKLTEKIITTTVKKCISSEKSTIKKEDISYYFETDDDYDEINIGDIVIKVAIDDNEEYYSFIILSQQKFEEQYRTEEKKENLNNNIEDFIMSLNDEQRKIFVNIMQKLRSAK